MCDFIEGMVTSLNKNKFACKYINNKLGNLIETVYQRPLRERSFKRYATNNREPLYKIENDTQKDTAVDEKNVDDVAENETIDVTENEVIAALLEDPAVSDAIDKYINENDNTITNKAVISLFLQKYSYVTMITPSNKNEAIIKQLIDRITDDFSAVKNRIAEYDKELTEKRKEVDFKDGDDKSLVNQILLNNVYMLSFKFLNKTLMMYNADGGSTRKRRSRKKQTKTVKKRKG